MEKTIDINCDLGEGGKFDADLMPLISSCNIACGGHYGDYDSVNQAVQLAKLHKVNVGAHPSYPDVEHFGRRSLKLPAKDLKQQLHEQIDLVDKACESNSIKLHHIKPHGALYNDMRKSQAIADIILEVVTEREMELILFTPPHVRFTSELPKSITLWMEGFADRAYQNDLSLVSRKEKGAVLHDPELIAKRVLAMVCKQEVLTLSGEKLRQEFDSICVHSDTPNALNILQVLRSDLVKSGIKIGHEHD